MDYVVERSIKMKTNEHDFVTYGRRFSTYKWFKPIVVAILFIVFSLIFSSILTFLCGHAATDSTAFINQLNGGYDTMDVAHALSVISSEGAVATMIPALALAVFIVKDRPFSSYQSSRGGWNYRIFFNGLLISLIIVGIPNLILTFVMHDGTGINQFTIAGFIMLTLLGPMQCVAEEYVFRGLLMQTFGSWFRLPVLAVILQAAIFASMHPYNVIGVLEVFVFGLTFGLVAWMTKGIEIASAAHIINNMVAFYTSGFGIGAIKEDVAMKTCMFGIIIDVVIILVFFVIRKKTNLFEQVKRDDVAEFNQKMQARMERKRA